MTTPGIFLAVFHHDTEGVDPCLIDHRGLYPEILSASVDPRDLLNM